MSTRAKSQRKLLCSEQGLAQAQAKITEVMAKRDDGTMIKYSIHTKNGDCFWIFVKPFPKKIRDMIFRVHVVSRSWYQLNVITTSKTIIVCQAKSLVDSFNKVKREIVSNVGLFAGKLKPLYHVLLNSINEFLEGANELDHCVDGLIQTIELEIQEKFDDGDADINEDDIKWDHNLPLRRKMIVMKMIMVVMMMMKYFMKALVMENHL